MQDPAPPALAEKGTYIQVKFGVNPQPVVIPPGLVGQPLSAVEQILTIDGIHYSVKQGGTDPTKPPNTVSKVSPPSGTSISQEQSVILYVVNYTNGTPTATPEPTATATPTPKPTATPTPKPTATPTPKPTATPTPKPTVTPTPTLIP